jgi:hypothetical protein
MIVFYKNSTSLHDATSQKSHLHSLGSFSVLACTITAAFLNLFTLEEPLKRFSGLREPLHKNYYIYSLWYVSVISKL